MRFSEIQRQAGDHAKAMGFHDANGADPLRLCMLVVTELAEAVETIRDGWNPAEVRYVNRKPEGFPVEIADAIIRLADIGYQFDLDLESVIAEKMAFNRTRPRMHGKTA